MTGMTPKDRAGRYMRAQLTAAINALLADAGISLRVDSPSKAQYDTEIPAPLQGTLFSGLGIDVDPVLNKDKSIRSIEVRWWYTHPLSGRSYCHIGTVGWDSGADCAWWGIRVLQNADGSARQGWINRSDLQSSTNPPATKPAAPEHAQAAIEKSLKTGKCIDVTMRIDDMMPELTQFADDYSQRDDGTYDVWGAAVGREWWLHVTIAY